MSTSNASPIEFYYCDFCPFAQRTWIALLEKESDPHHPKLFHPIFVNFYNKELPLTKAWIAATGVSTVPSGIHNGVQLSESLIFNEYVNEVFPQHPLLPETPADRFRARLLVEKFGGKVTGSMYKLLKETDKSQWQSATNELLSVLSDLSAEIGKSAASGPFFFGSQFTLTDIAFFPFLERVLEVLPHYRNFVLPETETFAALRKWYEACLQRPSVQISTADRSQASLESAPFGAKGRKEYLLETHEGVANNLYMEARKILSTAPPGKKTFNLEAALKEKNDAAAHVSKP